MKKLLTTSLATAAFAFGAFAQGSINLNNGAANNGITWAVAGNWFSGTYGLEVWILNSSTQVNNINNFAGVDALTAYNNMIADGFTKQATFLNQTITTNNSGIIALGTVNMPGVSPAGGTVNIALVAWLGSGSSIYSAVTGGVVAFVNGTTDYTIAPPNTPLPASITSGWNAINTDLIFVVVPEPSTFCLAGLGLASLLALRRRT